MARLIRIGHSHAVRIPKSLVKQAGLEGPELEITADEDGVRIRPSRHARQDGNELLPKWTKPETMPTCSLVSAQAPLTRPNGIGRSG